MLVIVSHLTYLSVSVVLTVWVARTLFRNGRVFLVDALGGDASLADSVNALLVVGFYLINIGYIAFALRYGDKPLAWVELLEVLGTKIGLVMLVLGGMHFFNLYLLSQARRRRMDTAARSTPAVLGSGSH